jgi:hypothetical protein
MIEYNILNKFIDCDELDVEYRKITNDILRVKDTKHALHVIFKYFRKHGFPHYDVPHYQRVKDIKSLINFDENTLLIDNRLEQTMHGLSTAWSYFPHWVDVRCGSSKMTPIEYWNSDEKLKEIIRKTWVWQLKHGNGKFTLNRLRQNFKIYGGNQTVSNFRPTVAKYLYNTYGNNGVIYDPSMGWGGRLLGFLSSNCKTYIGTDPSTKTYDGLVKLNKDLNLHDKHVEFHNLGSEIFKPKHESVDLIFTSPPYFDTEKYSDEPTQSYLKYPSEDLWLNGFLTDTINNCYHGLRKGGHMILNIANTAKHKNIEERTKEISEKTGFKLKDTIYLTLSSVAGKGLKLEPIFIFTKN